MNTTRTTIEWDGGWLAGSHEVAGKGFVNTEKSQMAYKDAIFTSKYHTKKVNPWPNLLASHVVNYSQLTTCKGDTESLILKNTQILVDV